MSEEAVRADNQQFHKLALERYFIVIRDLSDLLVVISQTERMLRTRLERPRRPAHSDPSNSANGSSTRDSSYSSSIPVELIAMAAACQLSDSDKHAIMSIRDQYIARVNVLTANLPSDITSSYAHPAPRTTWLGRNGTASASYSAAAAAAAASVGTSAISGTTSHPQQQSRIASFELAFLTIMRNDLSRSTVPGPFSFDPLIRPLQIMQRLAKCMTYGDFLTSNLYIPADVWSQPGGRIAFLDIKCSVFAQLFVPLGKLRSYQQDDPNVSNMRSFNRAIEDYESATDAARSQLLKKLKYLVDEDGKISFNFGEVLGGPMPQENAPTTSGQSRLASWGLKFQKSFEKFKSKDKSRDNSSSTSSPSTTITPTSAKAVTLISYRDIMTRFLVESNLVLTHWVDKVTTKSGDSDEDLAYENSAMQNKMVQLPEARHIRNKLRKLITFYDTVVCVILARDLHELVDRFTRKLRKISNI
eukprot:jgi/Hompol1/2379/HPOL_001108-RA